MSRLSWLGRSRPSRARGRRHPVKQPRSGKRRVQFTRSDKCKWDHCNEGNGYLLGVVSETPCSRQPRSRHFPGFEQTTLSTPKHAKMTTNQSISQSSNKLPVARLSPASLLLLIDTDPTPHLLLDIRPPAAQSPLPFPLPDSTEYRRAPIFGKERTELLNFLKSEFAEPKDPKRDPRKTHIVVVFSVNGNEAQTQDAVETLIWFGFEKLAVLEGGLAAFDVGSAEGRRAVVRKFSFLGIPFTFHMVLTC